VCLSPHIKNSSLDQYSIVYISTNQLKYPVGPLYKLKVNNVDELVFS